MRATLVLTLVLAACEGGSTGTDAGEAPASSADTITTDSGRPPPSTTDSGPPDASAPVVDPLQCHLLCASADAADCMNAPDHQTCFDLCERSIDRCPALVMALLDCFGPVPTFVCDADQNLASTDCAAALGLVQDCAAD